MPEPPVEDNLNELLRWKPIRRRIDSLRRMLADSDETVVPWVGAGLSSEYGFRLWRDFVRDAADTVLDSGAAHDAAIALLDQSKLDDATDVIDSARTHQFRNYVYDEFLRSPPISIPHCVAKLLARVVVTTNYDRVLEAAMPWRTPLHHKNYDVRVYNDGACILKLHGTVEDRASWVLTSTQYQAAYSGVMLDLLRRIMTDRHILFMGCSLQLDKYLTVLDSIPRDQRVDHYAVLSFSAAKDDAEVARRCDEFESRGILVIPYRRSTAHNVVKEILAEISPSMDAAIHRATFQVSSDSPERKLYVLTPWIVDPPADESRRHDLGRALGRLAERLMLAPQPHLVRLGERYLGLAISFAGADPLVARIASQPGR